MQFAHPNVLWLLLVIPPAMIAFYVWSGRRRQALITAFIQARLLPSLLAGDSATRRRIRFGLLVAAVCWIVVALARPQWGFTWEEVRQRGLDIVIAIDVSKSMLAEDIQPNRLARAKLAALDLLKQARSDRVGLVAFSGSAFLQCPLTIDDSVFRQSLAGLDVNTISRGGTAISEAIEAAMGAFTESENYKVLVLLTDGEDHDSGALETARQAATKGLEIFTVGVGTAEGELLRATDASGKTDFIRDEDGNVVKSRLNERILQELAGATSRGFYLPLRGPEVIDTLYAKGLAPIPKSEAGEKLVKRYHEQFRWPLGLAILLLIVEILYPERKRQKQTGKKTAPLPARVVALWIALLLGSPLASKASTGSAFRDYQSGEYDKALQEYRQLLERKPSDPRLHFNAGAAAYKGGLFNEAAKHFDEATAAQDVKLQQQAYYNRGNALFHSGEDIPDPSKRREFWNQSLRDYDTALKLDPNDSDAAHNREYVKRRLEELQQQQDQQKQQKQDQNKDEQQDQKDQQQQQSNEQEQDKKDQQQQQDQEQPQQEKQDDQQKQQQQGQDQDQPREQDQQQPRDQQQKQQEEERSDAENQVPGQMSPAEARQLLDAEKGDEKLLQFKPREEPSKGRPFRDW